MTTRANTIILVIYFDRSFIPFLPLPRSFYMEIFGSYLIYPPIPQNQNNKKMNPRQDLIFEKRVHFFLFSENSVYFMLSLYSPGSMFVYFLKMRRNVTGLSTPHRDAIAFTDKSVSSNIIFAFSILKELM